MVLTIPDVENLSLSPQVLKLWVVEVEVLEYYKWTFGLVFGQYLQMIPSWERVIENKEKKPNSAQLQQKAVGYNAAIDGNTHTGGSQASCSGI